MSQKRHHHSKFTLHQEAVIFNEYLQEGESLKHYADKYDTSVHSISRIIKEGLNKLKKKVA